MNDIPTAVMSAEPLEGDRASLVFAQRENLIDHGTVPREPNRAGNRVGAFDSDCLDEFASRLPAAAKLKAVRMRWIGLLLIQIAERANIVGHAPGHALVAAEHDCGHADVGHSRYVQLAAAEVGFVPARDRFKSDVWVACDHGHSGAAKFTRDDPVVASCLFGIAGCLTNLLMRAFDGTGPTIRAKLALQVAVGLGRNDGLLVLFPEEKCAVARAIAEHPFGHFRHHDHRKPAGQIPAKLVLNGQAVQRRPGLGPIVEQVEFDRRTVARLLDYRPEPWSPVELRKSSLR
jgi:hypothetical protein